MGEFPVRGVFGTHIRKRWILFPIVFFRIGIMRLITCRGLGEERRYFNGGSEDGGIKTYV